MQLFRKTALSTALAALAAGFCSQGALAQAVPLTDLSAFRTPSANWRIVGGVNADLTQKDVMTSRQGTGVLANLPAEKKYGIEFDLFTKQEHGDADVEFDFVMAKGSNSGVYLQGRYEIQLFDSWGKAYSSVQDAGGIYERWNDSMPEGQKGFEGTPPRLNVSRAPGLWQHLKISFQAPRFDAAGKKTANAKILRIEQNGVIIHENVELTGPTRGAVGNDEVARGPIRIQGDHGPVAFRNLSITTYDQPRPVLSGLSYAVAPATATKEADLAGLKPAKQGPATDINNALSSMANAYVLTFKGTLKVAQPGSYRFGGVFAGGNGRLTVNNQVVMPWSQGQNRGTEVTLPAGDLPFEYVYAKHQESTRPSLGLYVDGPGFRQVALHAPASLALPNPSDPIMLPVTGETVVHRSFLNYGGKRIPHGVSVGEPGNLSYSLDLENGALFRVWRGGFLNVTPMWNSRGNGMSMPVGSELGLSAEAPITAVAGSAATGYRFRGYDLDATNRPTFRYDWNNVTFEDQLRPDAENKYLLRTIRAAGQPAVAFTALLAEGEAIESQPNGTYLVDGTYYVRVTEGGTASVQNAAGGKKRLVAESKGGLTYALIF
jgi:hypothetical protein